MFVLTSQGGHARIHPFYICFPWSHLLFRIIPGHYTMMYSLSWVYNGLALIQFPVYGAIYYAGTSHWPRLQVLGTILGIHIFVILLSFVK